MLIDTHCHLNYPGLVERDAEVVAAARAAGVGPMISIATRESEWEAILASTGRHDGLFASIGIHPHEADAHGDIDCARLVARAAHPHVVAIGETGLDYHYDRSDRGRQQASFRAHIAAARETGLPLVVHSRAADADTAGILAEELARGSFRFVIHCFTAGQWLADACLELGGYLSLSGIVTFRNATELQDVARGIPADRLLIETDAPFLAPVPVRGRVCEPAYVAHTARFVAALRTTGFDAFAAETSASALTLFDRIGG